MLSAEDWLVIPLLSGKSLDEFTPEQFKEYVNSMYHKPEPKKSTKPKKELTWTVNLKGTLSIRIHRDPKWITSDEILTISTDTGKPYAEVHANLEKRKIEIRT